MSKKGTSTSGNRNMLKSASAVYALLVTMALPASEYVPSEHTAMKTGVLKRATPKSAPTFVTSTPIPPRGFESLALAAQTCFPTRNT